MYLEANQGTVQGKLFMTRSQERNLEEMMVMGMRDPDSGIIEAFGSTMPNSGDEVAALAIQNDGLGNLILTRDDDGQKVKLSRISSCSIK
jgi:hypothetical protein